MDQSKINKRLNNLSKVRAVVEIAKIDTIKKIANSNNIKALHYEIAQISKQIINYSKWLDKLTSWKPKQSGPKNLKTLWIFITMPSRILKTSYSKYERKIASDFNIKTDSIVAIGDPAIEFVEREGYNLLTSFQDLEGTSYKISALITHSIKNEKFNRVIIVSYASQTSDSLYTLYPFEDANYDLKEMRKKKFFYSLSDTKQQIFYNYIKNTIGGIYQEAYRNFYLEKLARHESSLQSIDDKISELKLSLVKDIRKKETEEMIHTIQSLKRR